MNRFSVPSVFFVALALAGSASGDENDVFGISSVPPPPPEKTEPKVVIVRETVVQPPVPAAPIAAPAAPVVVPAAPVTVPAAPVTVPAAPVAVPAAPVVAVPAAPVAVPAVPVVVPAVPVVAVPPPPPPPVVQRTEVVVNESEIYGPSAEDSSDPKRLLHVFCQAWKDEDWKRAWYCMEPSFRKKNDFAAFQRRFKDDAEMTGGLDDESITADPKVQGSKQTFEVTLSFQNAPLVKPRKVKATLKTTTDGFRIVESTILPVDLNDM